MIASGIGNKTGSPPDIRFYMQTVNFPTCCKAIKDETINTKKIMSFNHTINSVLPFRKCFVNAKMMNNRDNWVVDLPAQMLVKDEQRWMIELILKQKIYLKIRQSAE